MKDKEIINELRMSIDKYRDKINRIELYVKLQISYINEGILDYIDDDEEGNKNIIDNLKEDKGHWKEILNFINN